MPAGRKVGGRWRILEVTSVEGLILPYWPGAVDGFGVLVWVTLIAGCGEVTSIDLQSPGGSEAKADLVPGSIDAPEGVSLSELLQMQVGVSNQGSRNAGPGWTIRVFLSPDSSIDSTDHQIDQFVTTRDLPEGGHDTYLRNKKLSGIEPGQYYLGSIVDVTDVVPEISETNNTLTMPRVITVVSQPTAP